MVYMGYLPPKEKRGLKTYPARMPREILTSGMNIMIISSMKKRKYMLDELEAICCCGSTLSSLI